MSQETTGEARADERPGGGQCPAERTEWEGDEADRPRPRAGETLDILLRGRVRLIQARKGYRSSVDAMALACFARAHGPAPRRCVDLGAGTGLVAVLAGLRDPRVELELVERQGPLVDRARRNLALNGLGGRGRVHHLDVGDPRVAALAPAELVVCNPPYFRAEGRIPPADPERRAAHYETTAAVEVFAAVGARLLAPGGRMCLVYPFAARDRLLAAMHAAGLGRVAFSALKHRDRGDPPSRVLAEGRDGPPRPARWREDFILHPERSDDSRYGPEIEAWIEALGPRR